MRVLQVTDGYPPVVGGLERYVQTLGHALTGAGHEVVVATLARPGLPPVDRDGGLEVRRLAGVAQHLPGAGHDPGQIFHPTVPDPVVVPRLQALIRRFRPDVIHAHGWMAHSCLAVRRQSAALVLHLHEYGAACVKKTLMTPDGPCRTGPGLLRCTSCATDQYRGRARAGLLTAGLRMSRHALDHADGHIAISRAVADGSRWAQGPASDPVVIPTSVPDDLDEVATRTGRPPWLPTGAYALFVGALGPHKGIDVLVEASRRSASRLPLVVLGAPRHDAPAIGADQAVVRHDVPHAQVMGAWKHATVGVVPSVWAEPFGQVAVECQAVGTPVVASATGGLLDIVDDRVNGLLVPPGDVAALAGALDELAADADLRRTLGLRGQLDAGRFTISATLPRILDVYATAVERRGRRRAAAGW